MSIRAWFCCAVVTALGLYQIQPAFAQLSKFGQPGCEKCQIGEYRQRVIDEIPEGPEEIYNNDHPPCGVGVSTIAAVSSVISTAAKAYVGVVDPDAIAGSLGNVSRRLKVGGTVGSIFASASPGHAACAPVCVVVPQEANVRGVHVEINQLYRSPPPGTMEVVNPDDQAHHPDFARVLPPVSKDGTICVTAVNWAHGYTRTLILDAYFTSPKKPIEIIQ